jgi:hypothetical protein
MKQSVSRMPYAPKWGQEKKRKKERKDKGD